MTYECRVCGKESETQQRILLCINKDKDLEESKYERLFNGTVTEKLKTARMFKDNFEKIENIIIYEGMGPSD